MELDHPPARMDERLEAIHLALQITDVIAALSLIGRDDGRATAEPAQSLAEGQMKIEGEIAIGTVRGPDFFLECLRVKFSGELSGGRVGRVAGAGHVVFP